MPEYDVLLDWITLHVRNRDILQKQIREFKKVPGFDLVVARLDGDQYFVVMPELSDPEGIVNKCLDRKLGVVTLNAETNVGFLVAHWDLFKDKPGLCFYFVNPRTNEKWIIFPKTHDLVTEKSSLKSGLMSLFSGVEPYNTA